MFLHTLSLLTAAIFPIAEQRAPAPSSLCLDARAVQEVWPTAMNASLLRSADKHYRLSWSANCEPDAQPAALLARDGWICGEAQEFVRGAGQRCPVLAIEQLGTAQYRHLRSASAAEQRSSLEQSFRGSSEHCLDPARVRSWSVQGDSLIVQSSRVRGGSPYAYKVQLSGNCPEADVRDRLSWRSSTGVGRICGIPGEFAVFSSQHEDIANVARTFLSGRPPIAELRGCPIQSVQAMHKDDLASR